MSLFAVVSPVIDGAPVTVGDGAVRLRMLKIPAAEYATPLWIRYDATRVQRVNALPATIVGKFGSFEILSSDPAAGGGFAPPIHEADFSGGTLNGWGVFYDGAFGGNEVVINDPTGKFSKVVRLHLNTGGGHSDSNDFIFPDTTPGLPIQDLHVRWEVYVPNPTTQVGPTVDASRKLFYLQPYDGAVGDNRYHQVLVIDWDVDTRFSTGGFLDNGSHFPPGGQTEFPEHIVQFGVWWIIEVRFKVNNSGQSNGIWQAWHRRADAAGDMVEIFNYTGLQHALSAPFTNSYFRVGAQLDTFDDPGDEFRYIGRVAYSDQRIGP